MSNTFVIEPIFPCPIYMAKRDTVLDSIEKKEIENIIEGPHLQNVSNIFSQDSYIFNGKLKNIKQFCEEQLKIYVKEVINPKEELDFYITQSWLNITKPGEFHHEHCHSNSIISGVFYISTVEDDRITFGDPNVKVKEIRKIPPEAYTMYNATTWVFPAINDGLILFPSWLDHQVEPNKKATTDRISISFNTYVRGTLGNRNDMTELIL